MIGPSVKVAKIATGEIEEDLDPMSAASSAAPELGRRGGKARKQALSPEETAPKAAIKRWQERREQSP